MSLKLNRLSNNPLKQFQCCASALIFASSCRSPLVAQVYGRSQEQSLSLESRRLVCVSVSLVIVVWGVSRPRLLIALRKHFGLFQKAGSCGSPKEPSSTLESPSGRAYPGREATAVVVMQQVPSNPESKQAKQRRWERVVCRGRGVGGGLSTCARGAAKQRRGGGVWWCGGGDDEGQQQRHRHMQFKDKTDGREGLSRGTGVRYCTRHCPFL